MVWWLLWGLHTRGISTAVDIFFMHQGGASDTRIRWIDLDESETNLTAANTTGGGNYAAYWHGQTAIAPDARSIVH